MTHITTETEKLIEEFVRDVTKIPPMPKSEVRERISSLLSSSATKIREEELARFVAILDGIYLGDESSKRMYFAIKSALLPSEGESNPN